MAKDEQFTPNQQMGILVAVVVLLFLFFGLSGKSVYAHTAFYLSMFLGGIIAAYLVWGNEIGDRLHFTTYNLPLTNVILYGVLLGLMLATVENFTTGNTMFVAQSVSSTEELGIGGGAMLSIASLLVFVGLFSFVTSMGEETLTRGFLNSIAEGFSDNRTTMNISKFILIPLIFSLLHFFMWNNLDGVVLSGFVVAFLIMYHFTFAIVCQFSMDVTGSIYTPIAIHLVYNSIKMMMMLQAQGAF